MSLNGLDTLKLSRPPARQRVDGARAVLRSVRACGQRADWGTRAVGNAARAPGLPAAVAELSRLQYENAMLAEMIRRLQHDAPTIENVARAELGLDQAWRNPRGRQADETADSPELAAAATRGPARRDAATRAIAALPP